MRKKKIITEAVRECCSAWAPAIHSLLIVVIRNQFLLAQLPVELLLLMIVLSPVRTAIAGSQNQPDRNMEKLGLKFVADIPLPGGASRFDYQTIDEDHWKLYMSHMGANIVTVFDLHSRAVAGNISNIERPTGILVVPELNVVYVSSSGTNQVYAIDASSFRVIHKVQTTSFPDGIAYDPELKRVFVSCEFGGTVTVFDALTGRVIKNIKMGGHVGNTHFDPVSKMVYSTVQTSGELIEINPNTLHIVGRYELPGCKGPHGFYIDTQTRYAFITGEGNATYVVFDLATKKILSRGKVGDEPDVLAFDKSIHRLYVASESGVVSVFDVEKGVVKKVGEGFLAKNAHTVCVDQKTHLVFFPIQNVNGRPVLRVMKPDQWSK